MWLYRSTSRTIESASSAGNQLLPQGTIPHGQVALPTSLNRCQCLHDFEEPFFRSQVVLRVQVMNQVAWHPKRGVVTTWLVSPDAGRRTRFSLKPLKTSVMKDSETKTLPFQNLSALEPQLIM